jgi:hypothetical protein
MLEDWNHKLSAFQNWHFTETIHFETEDTISRFIRNVDNTLQHVFNFFLFYFFLESRCNCNDFRTDWLRPCDLFCVCCDENNWVQIKLVFHDPWLINYRNKSGAWVHRKSIYHICDEWTHASGVDTAPISFILQGNIYFFFVLFLQWMTEEAKRFHIGDDD